jgi:D-beta-D-heptose 7-phosphate kinase/D-beta-D-heptose 1-phosphate adenosyltransferase
VTTPYTAWDELLQRLPQQRVLVFGDVILDAYVRGDVTRISPEAPVPVLEVSSEEYRLGGAANTAANVASLGASVRLFGAVGEDQAATDLLKLCHRTDISAEDLLTDPTRPTSLKTRVIARTQQIVRLDRESRVALDAGLQRRLLDAMRDAMADADVVIVVDYDKGLLNERATATIRDGARSRGLPILVDPKLENFRFYRRVTSITPNTNEAGGGAERAIRSADDLRFVGRHLLRGLDLEFLLITRGPEGMSLFERGQETDTCRVTHIPAVAREVYDVTGAGDTVIAVFSTALAAGASPTVAARLANYAAGIVVGHLGCATVTAAELAAVLRTRADLDAEGITVETLPMAR